MVAMHGHGIVGNVNVERGLFVNAISAWEQYA
jgi:hypothetical protein